MPRQVFVAAAIGGRAAHTTWKNITGDWLLFKLPDGGAVWLPPDGRVQLLVADLAKWPEVSAWMEGLELSGKLAVG